MSLPTEPDGARPSPLPAEGIAAKRPPRHLSPNVAAVRAHQVASSADSVEIKEGTLIGDYVVQKRLDEGGMGTVYSAVHPVIGKKVAIKVLHPHVARQEEAVARFIQEARAVNAIGHPGIVDIFGFGRFVDGRHYITMEYLDGQQLLAYLNEHGPIPPLDVLPLAFRLTESLAAAHDKGVVHRDMKPENVFLGVTPGEKNHQPWPPRTKILDFGLAKLIEAEFSDSKPRTRAGVTVGTPYYMSPEQCRGKAIDRRADVYALGVMMYEMLTGRVPFYAAESVDVLYMHLTQEPEAPSSHRPVPAEIEALVLRCMAKAPHDRPQTMHELLAELSAVMAELMPTDANGERPEHELLQEAEAFFGGGDDLSGGLRPPETLSMRMEQVTIPMSAEGAELPTKVMANAPAPPQKKAVVAPAADLSSMAAALSATEGSPTDATDPAEAAPAEVDPIPSSPAKTVSEPAEHTVPSLPTPPTPVEAITEAESAPVPEDPKPLASAEKTLTRPAYPSKPPALDGFKTAITAVPAKYRPASRALWVAVVTLGVAVVVLAVLLIVGPGRKPAAVVQTAPQEADLGSVELRSDKPVDVVLGGRTIARKVQRILVARLPAGSMQVFVIKRHDGSEYRATVRVVAARTVSVVIPPG